jgi:type VI protein secretion system component Hcp
MKSLLVVVGVFALSAGLVAQGPPAKGSVKSPIAVTLGTLGCSTPLGTDAFDVLAWSFGASNPVDLSVGGGGAAGKVSVSDLNIQKAFDGCSPALLGAVATGKAFASLTLAATNKDGTTTTVTLSDVRVSSWQASGSSASAAAVESASFAFSKFCVVDGSSGAKFCYDLKASKMF